MKDILYLAALEFLRRGIINPKADAENFADWCRKKGITAPAMALQKWKASANTTQPPVGRQIAAFVENIKCDDLDAICAINKTEIVSGILHVHISNGEAAGLIDRYVCSNEQSTRDYLDAIGASRIEYDIDKAEPQRKPDTNTKLLADMFGDIPITDAAACSEEEARAFRKGIPFEDMSRILEARDIFRKQRLTYYSKKKSELLRPYPENSGRELEDAIYKVVGCETDKEFERLVTEYRQTHTPKVRML